MTLASQNRMLDVLYANPQGVLRMSDTVPGLVETSNNLGLVTTENGFVKADQPGPQLGRFGADRCRETWS